MAADVEEAVEPLPPDKGVAVVTIDSPREYTLSLQATPARVPQVRRIVAAHLRHWRLEGIIQPVSLGVCELLTNVHRHTKGDQRCVLELRWARGQLTASVADNDPRLPRLQGPRPFAERGRGLALIAHLSDSWGTHTIPDGKVVWFTLAAQPQALRPLRPLPPTPTLATTATVPRFETRPHVERADAPCLSDA
ncbi:ATP-binding protein [Streptomyces sp. NPDC001691]|uniref:ATP-binding protein n=1 Tax=unclassified Streptomyces TaxID=2593676 RepID=UPI001CB898E9|nr:ATP-binding protein [Streptomyces sp. SDr-06]